MSIRIQNLGTVQTDNSANAFLRGASAASLSFFVRQVTPHSGSTVETTLLQDGFGGTTFFVVFRYGAPSSLQVRWKAASGDRAANIEVSPGRVHHVAASIGPGFGVRWWLDGELAAEAAYPGVLASGGSASRIAVGHPESRTLDHLLDDPALWAGYELTESDVIALRDRSAVPGDIGGGTLGFHWTLDGTAPDPVTVGSAGVQDQSGNGRHATTIGTPAPTYAESLVYVPPPTIRLASASIGASGRTLIVRLEDDDGNPVTSTAADGLPTLAVNGVPATVIGPLRDDGIDYVAYPITDVVVAPGDVVTLSAAEGWLGASAPGHAPGVEALEDEPVDVSGVGQPDFPAPTGPRPMRIGYNFLPPSDYNPLPIYSNLVRQARHSYENPSGSPTYTVAPDGSLATLSGGTVDQLVVWSRDVDNYRVETPTDKLGYPIGVAGRYTLTWTGTSELSLRPAFNFGGTTVTQVSSDYDGTAKVHTRAYDVAFGASLWGPNVALRHHGADTSDVAIYPPDPGHPATLSLDGSSKFHPNFLARIAPAASVRTLDPFRVNSSNVRSYADHMLAPLRAYTRINNRFPGPLVTQVDAGRIDPWANDGYFYPDGRVYLKVTTAAPHGLADGDSVNLVGFPGSVEVEGGGALTDLDDANFLRVAHALSATEFALAYYQPADAGKPVVGRDLSGASVRRVIHPGMPPGDILELCGEIGADPWLCVPHLLDDASVAAWAADVAAWLDDQPESRRVRVEYSNEVWNTIFLQHSHAKGEGSKLDPPLSPSQWYARRSGQVHALFAAAFEDRRPGLSDRLVRVFATQTANLGITDPIAQQADAEGLRIDELAVTGYHSVRLGHVEGLEPIWAQCDVDHVLDCDAAGLASPLARLDAVRASLESNYDHAALGLPAPALVAYEGGTETAVRDTVDTTAASPLLPLTIYWHRHPRQHGLTLRRFERHKAEGLTHFCYYNLSQSPTFFAGRLSVWGAYQGWEQLPGVGDGSDGKNDNRDDLDDLASLVSPVAGAIERWAGRAAIPGEARRFTRVFTGVL